MLTGSTAKPSSSSRRTIPSHACPASAGSCSTSSSDGHIPSASPSRMPGRTPAASATGVTQPTRGSDPGSGASAAARVARRGRSRSAARSSNPGMRMQAIMGTYVLHEQTFSCQDLSVIEIEELNTRHGTEFELAGAYEGGEVGAMRLVDREGRRFVLKQQPAGLASRTTQAL